MSNFRSPKILALAKECPRCMSCGRTQNGQIVACHSNYLRHGKGTGIKAHDLPAYLCRACHDDVDGRNNHFDKAQRESIFLDAVFESVVWLLQSGHLEVKA